MNLRINGICSRPQRRAEQDFDQTAGSNVFKFYRFSQNFEDCLFMIFEVYCVRDGLHVIHRPVSCYHCFIQK